MVIDILGVISFAISGVLSSMKKKMDPFGIFIIAFVASVGGGTLRDILIGFPVAWMRDLTYMYVIMGTSVFAIIFRIIVINSFITIKLMFRSTTIPWIFSV